MKSVRLIHVYPNRRLYDLTDSKYVTRADVLKLIRKGIDVQVVDSVRGEDLTNQVLVDIMVSEELHSPTHKQLLPFGLLLELIRAGGGQNVHEINRFLSFALDNLLEQGDGAPNPGVTPPAARDPGAAINGSRRRGLHNKGLKSVHRR